MGEQESDKLNINVTYSKGEPEVRTVDVQMIQPPKPMALSKLAAKINTEHARVIRTGKELMRHILQCGDYLNQAKHQLRHGQFENWLEDNCSAIGRRMAAYYMQIADRFESLPVSRKQAIREMGSFRQIRDAILDKPKKQITGETKPKKKLRRESECEHRGCVREATIIKRCDAHMVAAINEWLEDASPEDRRRIHEATAQADE